jgi:hypothetical protein
MIISRTRQEMYQHEGVKIVDVADWLLVWTDIHPINAEARKQMEDIVLGAYLNSK